MWQVVVTVVVLGTGSCNHLIADIRRQLMDDNYDYMDDMDSDGLPSHPATLPAARRDYVDAEYIDPSRGLNQLSTENEPPGTHPERRDITVSNQDLLYYVDDQHLGDAALDSMRRADGRTDDQPDDHANDIQTPVKRPSTSRYQILQMKDPISRRNFGGGRRFIQEEGPDGVAILDLEGGPFPEFRLPKDRRQYMGDDEEVPDSDPDIAARRRGQLVPEPTDPPETTTPPPSRPTPKSFDNLHYPPLPLPKDVDIPVEDDGLNSDPLIDDLMYLTQ